MDLISDKGQLALKKFLEEADIEPQVLIGCLEEKLHEGIFFNELTGSITDSSEWFNRLSKLAQIELFIAVLKDLDHP